MCHFREVEAGRKRPNKNLVVLGQWRRATKMAIIILIFLLSSSSYRNCFLRVSAAAAVVGRAAFLHFSLLSNHRCAAALDFVCCAGCCNTTTTGELGWHRERRWLLRGRGGNGVAAHRFSGRAVEDHKSCCRAHFHFSINHITHTI